MKTTFKIIFLAIIFGAVAGAVATFIILEAQSTNQNRLIMDFYLTENASL